MKKAELLFLGLLEFVRSPEELAEPSAELRARLKPSVQLLYDRPEGRGDQSWPFIVARIHEAKREITMQQVDQSTKLALPPETRRELLNQVKMWCPDAMSDPRIKSIEASLEPPRDPRFGMPPPDLGMSF